MRIKKLLAVGMAVAIVLSMSACSMGNKTTYLSLSDEMGAIENAEFNGKITAVLGELLEDYDVDEVSLGLSGKAVKENGFDVKLDLECGKFEMEGSVILADDKAYVGTDTILSLISTIAEISGDVDEKELENMLDIIENEVGAEYIEAPAEFEGVEASKLNFSKTLKALDVLTKSYKSTLFGVDKGVYSMTITKDTVKSEVAAIKAAAEKKPKNVLPLVANFIDALVEDLEATGADVDADDMEDLAKKIREAVEDKDKQEDLVKDFEEFEENLEDALKDLDDLNIVSTIKKDKDGYTSTIDFAFGLEGTTIKFKSNFTIKALKEAKIDAPEDSVNIDKVTESLGMGDLTPDTDDKEEVKKVEKVDIDEDDDEDEAKETAKSTKEKKEEELKKEDEKPKTSTKKASGDIVSSLTPTLDKKEVQGMVKDITSELGGSWKKDYENITSDNYSYSEILEEDGYDTTVRIYSSDSYLSLDIETFYFDEVRKQCVKDFRGYLEDLFGKDVITSDVEEALASVTDGEDVDINIGIDLSEDVELIIDINYETDKSNPDFSGGWLQVGLDISDYN